MILYRLEDILLCLAFKHGKYLSFLGKIKLLYDFNYSIQGALSPRVPINRSLISEKHATLLFQTSIPRDAGENRGAVSNFPSYNYRHADESRHPEHAEATGFRIESGMTKSEDSDFL
jgi:hypothetical protein